MAENAKRRLAAVMFVDVVGYSRMVGDDEAGTVEAVNARWGVILKPLVSGSGGRIVKFVGDGALVEFPSAVNAVQCGIEIQRQMDQANQDRQPAPPIVLRMGINLGDVIETAQDIFGDEVNIAARLETLAEPGQICISSSVYDAIRGRVDVETADLGEIDLKNISRRVRAHLILVQGQTRGGAPVEEHSQSQLSIAVLPFDNMSGMPEEDYIGDGIAENILTDLSRFRDLTVIARNSSFAYKGRATRVQEIRRDLGANYILEGSIQKAGDRIRVTAQLIEGASGKHIWAERYDRRIDDLFAVMDEITELIVGTLGAAYSGRLRRAAGKLASGTGQSSFKSFDHFVQGLHELNDYTKESTRRAILHFKRAIDLNPAYAKAHAKLAITLMMTVNFGWTDNEARSKTEAREAALAALAADESEAWSHWAIAICDIFDGRHERALKAMRRAIELNPNDVEVLMEAALYSSWAGKADEGLAYASKAFRLNPQHPEYFDEYLGTIHFDAQQYDEAIESFNALETLSYPPILLYRAASHAALGQIVEAREVVQQLLEDEPHSAISFWLQPSVTPYARDADREHLAANLRLAGLPE